MGSGSAKAWRTAAGAMLAVWLASCGGSGSGKAAPPGGSTGGSRADAGAPKAGSGGAPQTGTGGAPQTGSGGAPHAGTGGAPQGGNGGAPQTQHDPRDAAADTGAAAGAASSDFATFLANAAHTGFVDDDTLVPPLRRLWKVSLGAPVYSYPLVAGDRVYVVTGQTDTTPARLLAFERLTGAPAWLADLPKSTYVNLAYENGRVFAVDTQGEIDSLTQVVTAAPFLRAFDAGTGALDWQMRGDLNQPFQAAPPVALNGTLYTTRSGGPGTPMLYAYDETSGQVRWSAAFQNGSFAVSTDGIFTYDACGNTIAVGLDGAAKWSDPDAGACYPAGTSVLFDHTLYESPERVSSVRVDARTGMKLGTSAGSRSIPAFGHGLEVDTMGQTMQAVSTATGVKAWTFMGEGSLAPALIVGGTVYAASAIGTISAIDATTGQVTWSDSTGDPFSGIAAAHGVLVVPAANDLIAYGPAGPGSDAGVRDYGGKTPCPWSLVHHPSVAGVATPTGIALADFDEDGKLDIVLPSWGPFGGGGVTVFLGTGDGSFQPLQDMSDFNNGTQVVGAADLDGDGTPDVVSATTNEDDGGPNVRVTFLKADASYRSFTNYTVGQSPVAMVLADLDGNGRPDLVVADYADGFRVLLNQGKGVLAKPVAYAAGQAAKSIALADLTGDGKPDLVFGTEGNSPAVQVFPGKGNGTFGAPLASAALDAAGELALGDVNGDGKLDVAVATGNVQILLGKGDGTFAPATTIEGGASVSGVALADVDLDGRLDLVVTNINSDTVRIFFGNGDGTFQETQTFATTLYPTFPTVTDLNGDGRPDIITVDMQGDTTTVLLGACGSRP
jgi:hypothetical protein